MKNNYLSAKGFFSNRGVISVLLLFSVSFSNAESSGDTYRSHTIGERAAVEYHMDQSDIERKKISLKKIIEHGKTVFDARFNALDGRGRPASTGGGQPRDAHDQPAFLRTSGPDANSCAGCHNQPSSGGAGDFVANVFVLAQNLDPVTYSLSPNFSNERNTLGMFGSGAIEMLAREMSARLISIRKKAHKRAVRENRAITKALVSKGVSFGKIVVHPDGMIDPSQIEGVDWDLIIKPFHQKGAVVSLREFSNNAANHHHGIQAVERFGENTDPDQDGVMNELSVGDLTALTVYQATLAVPKQKYSSNYKRRKAARLGKKVFNKVGCNSCHIPTMTLKSRYFSEPNPYNPAGNLQLADVMAPLVWDMTKAMPKGSLLKRYKDGAIINAFTDLKRHNLCDEDFTHFCNEIIPQGSLVGFADAADFTIAAQERPTEQFLTRKLWDVANSSPYGHRGDLTTVTEAVYQHGGEARKVRDAYMELETRQQDQVVEFLKTLGVF